MFSCKRCGYQTDVKTNIKGHLTKTKPCETTHSDTDRAVLLEEITRKNGDHSCDKCNKVFSHLNSKYRHQRSCGNYVNQDVKLKYDIKDLKQEIDLLKMRAAFQLQHKQDEEKSDGQENEQTEDTPVIVEQKIKPIIDGYLYIVWLREFVNNQQPVYKIGRSKDITSRIKYYPKDSKLLYCVFTTDIVEKEAILIQILKDDNSGVTQQIKYGTEYFLGDYNVIRSYIEQLL